MSFDHDDHIVVVVVVEADVVEAVVGIGVGESLGWKLLLFALKLLLE